MASTQKTLLFHYLSKALRIYFAGSRLNDFSGAHDYYDMWLFDEFHEPSSESDFHLATEAGTAFANMLPLLDRQECRLDSKYLGVFLKKINVPSVNSIDCRWKRISPHFYSSARTNPPKKSGRVSPSKPGLEP
ncbi:hypothetical protein FRX31_019799 [Thalictrum thalictroides]|uniref:Uncharacterized protein n=1 Tax=Thalictrum thalictroides TaxID=46969 RepID=A0A7J6VZR6_THATH|nr:hypothetical protein FRX31_019799 [Thalictrum thalictroides]